MVTCTTPWPSGASLVKTSLARSMMRPSTNGPRSRTVHDAVAPVDWLRMVTTVPIGNVRCAHVPGGAASYQVAPPLWVRPLGAVDDPPDGAGFGADLAAGAGLGAGFVVGVAARAGAFCTGFAVVLVVDGWRRGRTADVGGAVGSGSGATVVVVSGSSNDSSERLTRLSTVRPSATSSPVATETDADFAANCTGSGDGDGDACSNVSNGTPAIAAQSATGTARRAFLDPRVVRTLSFLQNAGAARPPPQC
jgi:hypothetical protein